VRKVKVDLLHKFDFSVVLPFIIGVALAGVDYLFVKKSSQCDFATIYSAVVEGVTIGALATVIFRFATALKGKNLKSMLKDDVFGIFYNELLMFGNVKDKLVSGKLKLSDFVSEIIFLKNNTEKIYLETTDDVQTKRNRLAELLAGVIDGDTITKVIEPLNVALNKHYSEQSKRKGKSDK
ncbi:MAG: hypothetical protein RR291_02300, partial [Clostridia bacterium]